MFTLDSLKVMKRMKDHGGMATCKQLSNKYGASYPFYIAHSVSLAKRVAKATGCPLLTRDTENSRWWPILYVGKYAEDATEGVYTWKLRDELSAALDRFDLSHVPLFEDQPTNAYTRDEFLAEVYLSAADLDTLLSLLANKKNLILQGPPGVGKTFAARRLAYAYMGEKDDGRIEFIQFHQSYSYEDFVLGYRPKGDGFELQEGVFYRFCQKAAADPDQPYFFIIDEINRGNISKIFGELLMLVEKDYRDMEVTLAYTGKPFSVPGNLYIIGIMNTADRSLAMIDYALRRRFSFFELGPAFDADGFRVYQGRLDNGMFDALIEEIKQLNRKISRDSSLGRGFCIGHSYFCGQATCSEDRLRQIVEYDIIPLLSEYWFDDPARLEHWKDRLRGVLNE